MKCSSFVQPVQYRTLVEVRSPCPVEYTAYWCHVGPFHGMLVIHPFNQSSARTPLDSCAHEAVLPAIVSFESEAEGGA